METRNPKMKRKHSMEMKPCKERKSIKVSLRLVSTQDIKPIDDKTSRKNQDSVIIYSRKEKKLEKAPGPGNNGSPKSCAAAADEKHDKAPLKQFTRLGNSARIETEQKEQEGCVAASPKLEARAGLENRVRQQDPSSSHSREKLLHKEMECCESESSKARVAQLKDEINLLCCQIQKYANMSMQLSEANRLLLDELKKVLDPSVIKILEAKNPDPEYRRSPQIEETPSEPSPE